MLKRIRDVWNGGVARPLIYMFLTRFGIGLCAALLLDFFVQDPLRDMKTYAFSFLAVLFPSLAWIAWLRLDGVQLPKPLRRRWQPKKKPVRTYGDIIDHVDEEPVSFEALDEDEQDVCCLLADAGCFLAFLLLALL